MATTNTSINHGISMMSPGSKVTIQDYSDYTSSQSTSVYGVLGPARKGPLKPTLVTSIPQFIKTFGAPDGRSYGAYGAIYYLSQGNQVYYQRIIHGGTIATSGDEGTDKFTYSAIQSGSNYNGITIKVVPDVSHNTVTLTVSNKDGKTLETYKNESLDSNAVNYISKDVNGTSSYIEMEQHSTGGILDKTFTLAGGEDGGADAVGGNKNISFTSLSFDSTLNGSKVKLSKKDFTGYFDYTLLDSSNNVLESFATVSDDSDDDRYLPKVLETYSGYLGASLSTVGETTTPTLDTKKYQLVTIDQLKTISPISITPGLTPVLKVYTATDKSHTDKFSYWLLNDKGLKVNGVDNTQEGFYTTLNTAGFKWANKSSLPYASSKALYDVAALAYALSTTVGISGSTGASTDGVSINMDNDSFTKWLSSVQVSSINATPTVNTVSIDDQTYEISGGRDGIEGIVNSDYIGDELQATGIYSMSNPDAFTIDLFAIPGMTDPDVLVAAAKMVSDRGDSFLICDVPFGLKPQDAVDWTNGEGTWSGKHVAFDTSFMGFYAPWAQVRDTYTGKLIWLPPTVPVAPRYAYTDNVGGPWLAPAGADRGKLNGIIQLEYTPTMGERDLMYGNRNIINPIVNMGVTGTIINGQKTAQRRPTALDRINVRRLVNYVQRTLQQVTQYFVFEPNDSATWQRWQNTVEPKLDALKNSQAISAYKVQMDETTVNIDDLENSRMPGLVAIKPTKSAEFIPITLRIDNQSAVYNDGTGTSAIGG